MPDNMKHLITIDGISNDLIVLEFEGTEGFSQLYNFSITIACEAALVFDDAVGKDAALTSHVHEDDAPRHVHGIVARFEQVDYDKHHWYYRVTLVPKVWRLQHRLNNRIFQDLAVPAIIEAVLKDAGITEYELKLSATYAKREYCVQYRESDWDFICRLMEEEGIYYLFVQTDSKHTLLLGDKKEAYPTLADGADVTLEFRTAQGALSTAAYGTHVSRFVYAEEVRSGKVTLRDYNFKTPALSLEAQKAGSTFGDLEVYDYPGEYDAKADGDTYAEVRLQELQIGSKAGDADSTCALIAPGHTFTLADHPRESFNQKYVVTRVEHYGVEPFFQDTAEGERSPLPYRNTFEVMPESVLFRPPRVTRRPFIHGVQTAIVVGASSDEICVDKHGRVKVQFHWDRKGVNDDKSSCWIRVGQIWASAAFGGMFIPRVKDEVIVAFLEGDPDRPIIVGCVYHGTNVPPYALPGEKTKSTIKTRSSTQGGDGYNELRFEDKKGSEEIFIHGQKDWTIKIENDKNQKIGHDETLEVGHDRTKTVKHDQTETVEHDNTLTVKHDQTEEIQHDETLTVKNNRTVTVNVDHTEKVDGNQSVTIGKAQTVAIKDKQDITVTKTRTLHVEDDVTETFDKKLTMKVTGDMAETISGKRDEAVTGDRTLDGKGKLAITIVGNIEQTSSTGEVKVNGATKVEIISGAATITISASGEIKIAGTQITVDASGPLKVHGLQVDVKADVQASVKAPMVSIEADAISKVKGGAMVQVEGAMVMLG